LRWAVREQSPIPRGISAFCRLHDVSSVAGYVEALRANRGFWRPCALSGRVKPGFWHRPGDVRNTPQPRYRSMDTGKWVSLRFTHLLRFTCRSSEIRLDPGLDKFFQRARQFSRGQALPEGRKYRESMSGEFPDKLQILGPPGDIFGNGQIAVPGPTPWA